MSQFIVFQRIYYKISSVNKVNLVKMNQQNPYMNLYRNTLNQTKLTPSKDYLFALAINFGHVHNLLGVMISDVINLMGNLSSNHLKNFKNQTPTYEKTTFNEKPININTLENDKIKNNKINYLKNNTKNQAKNNHSIPEKMEIQNLSIHQFNDKMKSDQTIKKQFLFNQFQFNHQNQKPKNYQNHHQKKDKFPNILQQLIDDTDHQVKKQQKEEDLNTSRTLSAEKVRYDQKYENQFLFEEFQNNYVKINDQKVKYEVNVKEANEKKGAHKKQKGILFELFDSSSQTSSNPQQENFIQKFTPISQEASYNNKIFYENQFHNPTNYSSNPNNFLKPKSSGYSTQIKNDKNKSKPKNPKKSYDLLQNPFSVTSSKSNLIDIDEIDQIQTSHKKFPKKIVVKKKEEQKKKLQKKYQKQEEYIPRREQIGRKKINRQAAKGSECPDCKAFYKAINDESNSFTTICQCTSRHKSSTVFMKKHHVQNYSQAFSLPQFNDQ